ncbi:MAG: hypothetical protein MI864_11475, partial [Pseudomonadales bacterium]|nr:hypothetical protein [Pseudomonadales bacterium]
MKSSVFLNLYFAFWAAWRRRYLIVIPIMIMPFIMLALGAMTPKKYQSHTTMLIQETTKLNPYLADFAVSTQLKERMAALKALLHSRHMLSEVALELGEIKTRDSKLAEQVISRLSASLTVQLIGSDMIKLVLVANKPTHMEKTLSVVSDYFLAKLLAPERSSIRASEVFLATQLKAQHESLLAAEMDLAMFKRKNSAHLPDQYNYDVLQLRDLEAKLRERSMALSGAQGQLKSLKTQLLKTNPMLASIEESIVQETARLALLSSRYTDRHSSIVSVKASLQRL